MTDRLLFVRPDHLGDVLLTLPAAALVREVLPAARVTYLVGPAGEDVARHCPHVDEVLVAPFPPPDAHFDAGEWAGTVAREAARLDGRFDVALVLRPDDPWSGTLVAAADIPIRLGYDLPRTRPFLTHPRPYPNRRHAALLATDLAAVALDQRGITPPAPSDVSLAGCFRVSAAEEAEARAGVDGAGIGESPIVLHPGSGWPVKNWPSRRWGEVAAALAARYDTAPVVVGGKREGDLVERVVQASGGRAVTPGRPLSLGGLAALHRSARLVIATDSGPLHLAAMMGAPVVGLYGPADPLVFAPLAGTAGRRVLWAGLACSPCGRLHDPPCGVVHEPACVTAVSVAAVLTAAGELLSGAVAPSHPHLPG
jgi:ADP-heptose:LPS heptosyltransferase